MAVMDPAEQAAARTMAYYQELEMILALLVVRDGERTDGGFRLVFDADEAFRLRGKLGTGQPVVIKTFENATSRYVIDVL